VAPDKVAEGGAHPGRPSTVRGEEEVDRRRSEAVVKSGGRIGRQRGPVVGGGKGKGEGPLGLREGACGVELTVGGDRRRR
jgi:hypothetical protein